MDTTTQQTVEASVDRLGQLRAAVIGAIVLALIVASIAAWALILDHVLSAHP